MTLIKADTAKSVVNGYAAVAGIAAGLLYTGTLFPVVSLIHSYLFFARKLVHDVF